MLRCSAAPAAAPRQGYPWQNVKVQHHRTQAPVARIATNRRNALMVVRCQAGNGTKGQAVKLRLSFKVPYHVNFGQSLMLVGTGEELGNWDPKQGKRMTWSNGDVWNVDLEVDTESQVQLEYKYVVCNQDGIPSVWKPGQNYQVTIPIRHNPTTQAGEVAITDAWDGSIQEVQVVGLDDEGHEVALTPEQEIAAVRSLTSKAMVEVLSHIEVSGELQQELGDPAAMEVLHADRQVAASVTKLRDLSRVLKAVAPPVRLTDKSEAVV